MKKFFFVGWREDGEPGVEFDIEGSDGKVDQLIFDTVAEAAEWAEVEPETLIEMIETPA